MSTLHVLVPHGQRLYGEALRTALEADPSIEQVTTTALGVEADARVVQDRRPDLFLVAATTADGEGVRLAHRLSVTTGVPVGIFDAPDDPAFSMAAHGVGIRAVIPRTTSWHALRAHVRGQLAHDPVPAVGPAVGQTAWHSRRRRLLGALERLPSVDRVVLAMSLRGVPRSTICVRTGRAAVDVDRTVARGHHALDAGSAATALEAVLRHGLFESFSLDEEV